MQFTNYAETDDEVLLHVMKSDKHEKSFNIFGVLRYVAKYDMKYDSLRIDSSYSIVSSMFKDVKLTPLCKECDDMWLLTFKKKDIERFNDSLHDRWLEHVEHTAMSEEFKTTIEKTFGLEITLRENLKICNVKSLFGNISELHPLFNGYDLKTLMDHSLIVADVLDRLRNRSTNDYERHLAVYHAADEFTRLVGIPPDDSQSD